MPAISITNDQRERLRWVQRRLGEDLEYGHVRPRDALEYLLDRFDEGDADGALAEGETGTARPGSSEDAEPPTGDPSGEGVPTDPEPTAAATTTQGGASEFVVRNGIGVDGDEHGGDVDERGESDVDRDVDADTGEMGEEAPESSQKASSGESSGEETAAGDDGGTTLNSMMSLLDDHDGKWREAGGGEEKYEVDLPEGGTERARTKDDVRAVLFKHYR